MSKIQARISYKNPKTSNHYKTSLKLWLTKQIEFNEIKYAKFSDEMVLSVVEFDKNNCIYVLLPKTVFKKNETAKSNEEFTK